MVPRGTPFPTDDPGFEAKALCLHLAREAAVPSLARRVFFDRGALDHLAYARSGHWELTPAEIRSCTRPRYDLAFLIEPPPAGIPTLSHAEAAFVGQLVAQIEIVYAEAGIPLIRVPYRPCDERARLILHQVTDRG